MLVRENLLLAACFVALLYASITTQENNSTESNTLRSITNSWFKRVMGEPLAWLRQPNVLFTGLLVALLLIAKETYQSFEGEPFSVDVQCQVTRPFDRDGWTSGRHLVDVPVGTTGLVLNLATTQPDVATRPLPGSLVIWFNRDLLLKKDFVLNQTIPQSLTIDLPEGRVATPDDYQIELKLQRCFIPKNFGINGDGRRLGVRIDSIDWRY
jgi:hypothetical protein